MPRPWTHLRVEQSTKDQLDHLMLLIETTYTTGRDPGFFISGRISVNSVLTHLIRQAKAQLEKRATKETPPVPLSADEVLPALAAVEGPKKKSKKPQPPAPDTSDAGLARFDKDMEDTLRMAQKD